MLLCLLLVTADDVRAEPAPWPASAPLSVDLGGSWSDADTRAAVAALGQDLLDSAWRASIRKRRPIVRLEEIRNKSMEHINTEWLRRGLGDLLTRRGLTIASSTGSACPDLLLDGWLTVMHDDAPGKSLRSYELILSLVDLGTAEKRWTGTFRVRKLVEDTGSSRRVAHVSADERIDLSGTFNDTDLMAMVRGVAAGLLGHGPVIGARPLPLLRIEPFRNLSSEHVNLGRMARQLEVLLLRSGRVRLLADREDVTESQCDTRPQNPLAPSHVVVGSFASQVEHTQAGELRRYLLTVKVKETQRGTTAWMDTQKVFKLVTRKATTPGVSETPDRKW